MSQIRNHEFINLTHWSDSLPNAVITGCQNRQKHIFWHATDCDFKNRSRRRVRICNSAVYTYHRMYNYIHRYTYICIYIHVCIYAYMHICIYSMHTYTNIQQIYIFMYTYMYKFTYSFCHVYLSNLGDPWQTRTRGARACAHMYTHIFSLWHTHIHKHVYAHKNTHTHTNTYFCVVTTVFGFGVVTVD